MKRNLVILNFLSVIQNAWFWLGIWVWYYLQFTNYAGIGSVESAMMLSITLSEIPTGALTDIVGKKITLLVSFLFQFIGMVFLAIASNLWFLVLGVVLCGIGISFYSGTNEALLYDSLKQERRQKSYSRYLAVIKSLSLISPALAGLIGSFLYTLNPQLPFILHASLYFVGMILCLSIQEPKIDTEKSHINEFWQQTKQGFRELTNKQNLRSLLFSLLAIGFVLVIADEMLNSFLGVEFGFTELQLGIFFSLVYLVAALSSYFTPSLIKHWEASKSIFLIGIILSVTLVISPLVGLIIGSISLIIRQSMQVIFENLSSITINENTPSKYRATTLSTFNLLKNLPYVFTAYFLGTLADWYSAKTLAFFLGIILIVLIYLQKALVANKQH